MDHGGDAASSTELCMACAVQGSGANIGSSGAFDGQLGAAAAPHASFSDFELSAVAGRGEAPVAAEFHLHHEPALETFAVAHPNIAASWRQLGPVDVLAGPQRPDGVMPVYSVMHPRPGAGRGVVLVDLHPGGGAVYNWDYALQPRPGAGHAEVLGDLLGHGAEHGEVFVGLLPGGGGGGAVHDDYGYYPWQWQPFPDGGRFEVFIGPLPDGVGAMLVNSGSFAQQTPPGTGRAEGITGALRGRDLCEGYDGSGALADDLGAVYGSRGMVAEHLRRLLAFAGIGASSVAINGLAAGPGSPAVAFHLFVLLLGGLFLVILHVLRV